MLSPIGFSLEVAFIGLLMLVFSKRKRLAKLLILLSPVFLLLFSLPLTSRIFLGPLETYAPPFSGEGVEEVPDYIVVLGCGDYTVRSDVPMNVKLNPYFWARLSEGIRVAKRYPEAQLLLSLPGVKEYGDPEAALLQFSLESGIERKRLVLLDALDTAGEAEAAIEVIGEKGRCFLVTSAFHMKRSVLRFRLKGVQPIAAPCDYRIHAPLGGTKVYQHLPSAGALLETQMAIKEYIGILKLKIFG